MRNHNNFVSGGSGFVSMRLRLSGVAPRVVSWRSRPCQAFREDLSRSAALEIARKFPAAYSLRWQGSAAVALRQFVSIIERAADRMEKVICE